MSLRERTDYNEVPFRITSRNHQASRSLVYSEFFLKLLNQRSGLNQRCIEVIDP